MTRQGYDVIIIGAGSMGMSAGYHLAQKGAATLMIDASDPPHQEGSHHGDTRLIRHAYKGGAAYIPLALRSHELWKQLEQIADTQLLVSSGVLNVADPDYYSFGSRPEDARAFGVSVEMLDAAEIGKRWPGWSLPEHFVGMYEPGAGYLFSERCIAAYRRAAMAAGAELLTRTQVVRIAAGGDHVAVTTNEKTYYAEKVLLSVGAWFAALKPFISLPVRPVRKAVGWFRAERSLYAATRFPGFTLHGSEGGYYGFPDLDGTGLKIGRHDGGKEWSPGEPWESFGSYHEDERDLRNVLESYMPQAAGQLQRGSVCKYEMTPDEHFIIDRHPEYANVLLAAGFSGHGFKFSSVVGEIAADLLTSGRSEFDLRPFALSRF
ncbi:N-methyl-L-tryptophan oxidase [Paenibacillus senegalensis]|uniref:N-methyl-L-tryptophan oxidase n=1 Tax=Paenibacillus senegalensis TaxID=1465766 RepID=UPI00028868AD|nr:N-methyl-L-tryptophan oxidase [Paenibacillus senegalensis]